MTQKTALIVGAGVAGLAAAYWLKRIGWRTIVIERAPALRSDGYMLGLSGPGYDIARRMGILPGLQADERAVRENLYRDRHGREVLRLRYQDFLAGVDWVTLPRTALVAHLQSALGPDSDIRYGLTLTRATDLGTSVEADLSDGSTLTCDLLIGADGVHSTVRALSFGPEAEYAKPLGYRFAAFQVPNILGLGDDFLSYVAPRRTVEFYTLWEDRLATLYAWRSPETGRIPPEARRQVLRAVFADLPPDVHRVIDSLSDEDGMAFDDMLLIEMPRWRKGRILLLGDAAHCLTLISGQGAGMAITSAWLLAEELTAGDIDAALDRHEAKLRPTITALQTRSRKIAGWFIPGTPWGFRLRNFILRRAPRRFLARYFQKAIQSEIILAARDFSTS
ncbi:hypothetical protein VZ95_01205 [Elstera litoralis]|uniref:FAD-binding domain-containing protein n=1 Tax=Elstera litoralis TaxID=552518 RepID=A0A0F3IZF8_9PROT|nr:FAD-dependent oxidoreductase [Elstera litoralis]KJV11004.1 hypothetical protein VZ95_01205 [Elstera litoralis]